MSDFPATRLSLIAKIRLGDEQARREALEVFIAAYRPALVDYLVKVRQIEVNDAEDLVNEFILAKILDGDLLSYSTGTGRLRNLLRTCLKNLLIDHFRKEKRSPVNSDLADNVERSEAELAQEVDPIDRVWAVGLLGVALARLKHECTHWDLFVDRILTQPSKPYEEIIQRYGFETPKAASNCLMTAKRSFNRILSAELEAQNLLSTGDSRSEEATEADLLRIFLQDPSALEEALSIAKVQSHTGLSQITFFADELAEFSILEADAESNWAPHELGMLLDHWLSRPLSEILENCRHCPSQNTLGVILEAPQSVSKDCLLELKGFFNQRGKSGDGEVPRGLYVTMTYATIALCLRSGIALEEITSMPTAEFSRGADMLLAKPWLPTLVRACLENGKRLI